jgi:hypothetical protein
MYPPIHLYRFSKRCLKEGSFAGFSASLAKYRINADYPAALRISSQFSMTVPQTIKNPYVPFKTRRNSAQSKRYPSWASTYGREFEKELVTGKRVTAKLLSVARSVSSSIFPHKRASDGHVATQGGSFPGAKRSRHSWHVCISPLTPNSTTPLFRTWGYSPFQLLISRIHFTPDSTPLRLSHANSQAWH